MESHGDTSSRTHAGSGVRVLGGELSALVRLVGALSWRTSAADTLHHADNHPVPVVLVHGLLGDPTNFVTIRRELSRHGIRRFSCFGYPPRVDYQRLAARFGEHVEAVCRDTGTMQVDVVAHSLGGLVARYFVQTAGDRVVRRLVTLGTPYLASTNPSQELSIFAERDVLVPAPQDGARRRAHVVPACGHLGLLTDERAATAIVRYLTRPTAVARHVGTHAA